jgi:hypothetical protein
MDVVLFPYSPFELIDNYLAFRMCQREGVTISISTPYLQLFYNSFTPYLSKHFMEDLYGEFDEAYSAAAGYYGFVEKALKIYDSYINLEAEKVVYAPVAGIGDFFRGIGNEVFLADGDIRNEGSEKRTAGVRALCGSLSKKYGARFIPVHFYDDLKFGTVTELRSAIRESKTILILPRKAFLEFIDSTFIFIPHPERVNPSAQNLKNLCRLYYLLKEDPKINRALIAYFGALIAVCEEYTQLPDLLEAGMNSGEFYAATR